MDPEEKALLEELVKLTDDNNKILHKMRAAAHWSMVWSFVKFLIIVIPILLVLAHLRPYIESSQGVLDQMQQLLNG